MQAKYSHAQVELLIGLRRARAGKERITIADIMSWRDDPGGDHFWQKTYAENYPQEAWMAKRGPLAPDSTIACVYYDFVRAMRGLELFEQAVIALLVMGFTKAEIAALFDTTPREIGRVLKGRPKRDALGKLVRNDEGKTIFAPGAVIKLTNAMNGRG